MQQFFNFDKSQLRIEYVGLKALSKATIDPRIEYEDANGNVMKCAVPTSVARLTRKALHEVTRFAVAYPACLAFIDDRLVALDVAVGPKLKMFQESGEWISCIEGREGLVERLSDDLLWDGQYAFRYEGEVMTIGESNYGWQKCRAFNMYRLSEENSDPMEQMAALCYRHPITGEWIKSPPISKTFGTQLQLTGSSDRVGGNDVEFITSNGQVNQIARMDYFKFVNLRFVNYASRVLSRRFGYESIEPLGLPLLMIEHRTFNIGGLTMPVQISSPAPLKFSEAIAWLVGFHMQVQSLDDLISLKQTFRMLMTKGITSTMSSEEIASNKPVTTKSMLLELRKRMESAALIDFSAE